MNAANEEAVFAFLEKKIKFLQIYEITKKIYDNYQGIPNPTLEEILSEDEKVRFKTIELINNMRNL